MAGGYEGGKFFIGCRTGGFEATMNGLGAAARFLPAEAKVALRNTLLRVERIAKERAPVGHGPRQNVEHTRQRIHAKVLSGTEGVVGTDQAAAMAIDSGAKAHIIEAKHGKALAIPLVSTFAVRSKRGKVRFKQGYRSLSETGENGEAKYLQRPSHKDVAGAPNGQHLDVNHILRKRVRHPGSKGHKFLTIAAKAAEGIAEKEVNAAVGRAIAKGKAAT